jgi:hypothetical protein
VTLRKVSKDHLPPQRAELSLVDTREYLQRTGSPLKFWTLHATKPFLVDLTDLQTGQERPKKPGMDGRWLGGYSGRPSLIHELLPAIKEKLMWASEKTCKGCIADLKNWWRLFDEMEAPANNPELALAPTNSVKDLTYLHQQLAVQRFSPGTFSAFRSIADMTRRANGMSPLVWNGPESLKPTRDIPTSAQSRVIFTCIKREWFKAIDRWTLVDNMLTGTCVPLSEEQVNLHLNAEFSGPLFATGILTTEAIKKHWEKKTGRSSRTLWRDGLAIETMFAAFFPTAFEIKIGFHLALIGGGWNVQTLLDLPVNADASISDCMPFLRNHPRDPSRYIITGYKARSTFDQIMHGDWKSDRSPGKVIRTLVERTWPLRQELVRNLRVAELTLNSLISTHADVASITKARTIVLELQRKSRSVWIYRSKGSIEALSAETYDKHERNTPILRIIVERINEHRSLSDGNIPWVKASDFRDIFAEYVYRVSGGSVLAVQKALGHRSPFTTSKYLDNKIINAASARTFVTYTNEMWSMCFSSGQLDHTVLRQILEREHITPEQRLRLAEYRKLKKSRIGVGCKDPTNPPARIAPQFKPNGQTLCTVQRCTLCIENAVIAPESLDGLAMRLVELRYLRTQVPIEHFCRGEATSWQIELENTETALLGFDSSVVETALNKWLQRVEKGEHSVPEFNGDSMRNIISHV